MYFPDDMNFQYFFFNTYPGYFLQALPVALLAGVVYGFVRVRKNRGILTARIAWGAVFSCYLTGLVCLTLLFRLMQEAWYRLLYHMPSGNSFRWFTFEFDLIPDFHLRFGAENLWNILMFLPFGILHPLAAEKKGWLRTAKAGVLTCLVIELLQPILDRSFDINDVILNSLGVLLSASIFYGLRCMILRRRNGIL